VSVLTVTLDTTDKNVVVEVADMLRRLVATEQDYGYPVYTEPTKEDITEKLLAESKRQAGVQVATPEEDHTATLDAGQAFGMPVPLYAEPVLVLPIYPNPEAKSAAELFPMPPAPPLHPTTESLLAGNGIPGFDGVPHVPSAPPVAPVVPPVPAPPTGAKLDSEGLPWDRRIHASTKTRRVSDDTWKLIKGVAPALVEKVKGELRLAMGAAPVVNQTAAIMRDATPPTGLPNLDNDASWPDPPGVISDAVLVTPPAPPLTLVPPLPPAPPAPPADDPFPEFVQFCTSNQQSGKLEYAAIVSTCQKYGIMQLPMLNARHDLIPTIRAELEALCKP
jgi:hypothetical protein